MGTMLKKEDFPVLVERSVKSFALSLGLHASFIDLHKEELDQVTSESIDFLRMCFTKPPVDYYDKEIGSSVSWLCKSTVNNVYLFRLSHKFTATCTSFNAECCTDVKTPDPNDLHRVIDFFQNWRSLS